MANEKSIEVTDEMLQVGAEIIVEFEFGWASPQDFARRIYLAMEEQRCRQASQQCGSPID